MKDKCEKKKYLFTTLCKKTKKLARRNESPGKTMTTSRRQEGFQVSFVGKTAELVTDTWCDWGSGF